MHPHARELQPQKEIKQERGQMLKALTCLHQSCSLGSRCTKQTQGSCGGLVPFIPEGTEFEAGGGVKRWARRTSAVLVSTI